MRQIIEVIKQLEIEKSVQSYNWDLNNPPIIIPDTLVTDFERNVYLKHNLLNTLLQDDDLTHHYWIVNGWGRIRSFKKTDRNNNLVRNLMTQLNMGFLRKSDMGVIASLSKIASFYNPAQYAIYDSRAIYSLNWLIFKYCDTKHLFPQPSGRGESVSLDMETIYKLTRVPFTVENSRTAYFKYCDLMRYISGEVYGEPDKPYMAEMMLFQITGDFIKNNILDTVEVKLKSN